MKEGAAIAIEDCLREESVPLETLKLAYNNFREKHMIAFARAFRQNTYPLRNTSASSASLGWRRCQATLRVRG
jgi:hypothetical protein